MKRGPLALVLVFVALSVRAAPPGTDPNWPCQQIKVPELSIASVWNGPPLDQYRATCEQDAAVAELAHRLAQRRMPLDQAEAEIKSFAEAAGADKQPRLLALFAALFDLLSRERDSIMAGLDRFGARQSELAADIRAENDKLQELQAQGPHHQAEVEALTERPNWDLQVFQNRRDSLSYACDAPALVEQRLFALARVIEGLLRS